MGGLSRIRLDGLANNSVANTNIVDGAVGAAEIATGAVKATAVSYTHLTLPTKRIV
mgnify:CR=1 FL=1